jgi:hypothetical protein
MIMDYINLIFYVLMIISKYWSKSYKDYICLVI